MDPITIFAALFTAAMNMATEAMKGQTTEQKNKIWQWFIDDMERWRKIFHLDSSVTK